MNCKIPIPVKYPRGHNKENKSVTKKVGKFQRELTDLRVLTGSNVAAVLPCTGYKIYIVFNSNAAMFHIDDLTLRE